MTFAIIFVTRLVLFSMAANKWNINVVHIVSHNSSRETFPNSLPTSRFFSAEKRSWDFRARCQRTKWVVNRTSVQIVVIPIWKLPWFSHACTPSCGRINILFFSFSIMLFTTRKLQSQMTLLQNGIFGNTCVRTDFLTRPVRKEIASEWENRRCRVSHRLPILGTKKKKVG